MTFNATGRYAITGALAVGGVAAGAACDEVEIHDCIPISVSNNVSTGRCDDLPWPHQFKLVVWCDGPDHPMGPTPYASDWQDDQGISVYVVQGSKCQWPNYVNGRNYDFAH